MQHIAEYFALYRASIFLFLFVLARPLSRSRLSRRSKRRQPTLPSKRKLAPVRVQRQTLPKILVRRERATRFARRRKRRERLRAVVVVREAVEDGE